MSDDTNNKVSPTHTRQGFLRAKHITDQQVEAILTLIAAGAREGSACRAAAGTSYTQFLRRVKGTEWEPRLRAAERERRLSGKEPELRGTIHLDT